MKVNSEAPRPQGGASRKRNTIFVVPLDPAYKAGLAGHLPVKSQFSLNSSSVDAGNYYVAHVEEGLGITDLVAGGLTFFTNDLSCLCG